jgi:thymidylate kinase
MLSKRETGRSTLISFSGIDGAGKTAQIDNLCAMLDHAGRSYRVLCFWVDVACFARSREEAGRAVFQGDPGVGTPEAPIHKRDKNVQSWIMTCIRLFLYFADAIALRRVIKKARLSGVEVCIFDRFIYDEVANLPLKNPLMRMYARTLIRLAGKPDISYLLDADPLLACARKPEYPLDFLSSNRKAFLALNELTGRFTVVAAGPLRDVEQEVLRHAVECLALEPDRTAELSPEPVLQVAPGDGLADRP